MKEGKNTCVKIQQKYTFNNYIPTNTTFYKLFYFLQLYRNNHTKEKKG